MLLSANNFMHICFCAVDKVDMLISIVLFDFWKGFDDFLIDDIFNFVIREVLI